LHSPTHHSEDEDVADELRGSLDVQARLLYGLIHARWITTARGLQKMVEKYKRVDFGRCPRVLCHGQFLMPVGLTDAPYEKSVKLYCARCEDIYSPKSSRHGSIDGAYFGTTFPHLLFLVYPYLLPHKGANAPQAGTDDRPDGEAGNARVAEWRAAAARKRGVNQPPRDELPEGVGEDVSTAAVAAKAERYHPRIFGFQVHELARWHRWQEAMRDR
jgi:casein kinase II subunit beta